MFLLQLSMFLSVYCVYTGTPAIQRYTYTAIRIQERVFRIRETVESWALVGLKRERKYELARDEMEGRRDGVGLRMSRFGAKFWRERWRPNRLESSGII